MKLFALFVILSIFSKSAGLAAQALPAGDFTPHVTHIRAEVRNNLARLTWVDSPHAHGPVYIFRSTRPFTDSVPPHIRPVVVGYGTQSYIDDTDDLENLYYFIAASDISGQRFNVILPGRNTISTYQSDEPVEHRPPEIPIVPTVQPASNLMARQDGDRVIITYMSANLRQNIILFRSMQPIRQPHDLINAIIVQNNFVSPFVDYPVPGITWYYAVLYENEIFAGNFRIRPGFNATVSPVIVSAGLAEHSLRPAPLPPMTTRGTESTPLRQDTLTLLQNMQVPPRVQAPQQTPRVFYVDTQAPSGGEDLALYQIVNDHFGVDWESARSGLQLFLSSPRQKNTEIRARFYLAQAFYFTGNYREALLEFLLVRSDIPDEANNWINATLAAMTGNN